jgi:glucose-1-phosphate adenylyltransferase
MGIYVFSRDFLLNALEADAADTNSSHDFGADIIPAYIESSNIVAYPFSQAQDDHYWKDVGTLDAYFNSSMDLVKSSPEINLYDQDWPIWNVQEQLPPAKFVFHDEQRFGYAANSLVSAGCVISGANIEGSLLHGGVVVDEGTRIEQTIVLPDVTIGKHCRIKKAIIEECCRIPDNLEIGYDHDLDSQRFHVTENGITIVCADMLSQKHTHLPAQQQKPTAEQQG